MANKEQWSRFCGSGIGLGNHKTQYTSGVLISNWSENEAGKDLRTKGELSEVDPHT